MSYYSSWDKREEINVFLVNDDSDLVRKKRTVMPEHDLRINEKAFYPSRQKIAPANEIIESEDIIEGIVDEGVRRICIKIPEFNSQFFYIIILK